MVPEKLDNVGQSDFALRLPKSPGTLLSWPEAVVPDTHTHREDGAVVPVSHTHTHTHTHTHRRWGCGPCLTHTHTHTHTEDGAVVPLTLTHTLTQREDGAAVPITRHRASHLPWLLKQGAARTSLLGSEHLPV